MRFIIWIETAIARESKHEGNGAASMTTTAGKNYWIGQHTYTSKRCLNIIQTSTLKIRGYILKYARS